MDWYLIGVGVKAIGFASRESAVQYWNDHPEKGYEFIVPVPAV